jgi:hypothetical protein
METWIPSNREIQYFDALLDVANGGDGSNVLTGPASIPFFKLSGLDRKILKEVVYNPLTLSAT